MQSTFSGVEIAKRGILAHSQLLRTAGHNLSNINTPGYSRQRVNLASSIPIYMAGPMRAEVAGQIGQGVDIQSIQRQKDEQIANQIVQQSHKQGYWNTRSKYIGKLEDIQNEVGESSLRGAFDRYWQSWEELSLYPEEMSARIQLVERSETLVGLIRERSDQLDQIQTMVHLEIDYTVSKTNELAQEIATLNTAIQQAKAVGDMPNDLMDRRDLLLDELAQLVNITVDSRDPDELMVHTNGKILVQGKVARALVFQQDTTVAVPTYDVYWSDTQDKVDRTGGVLSSLLELRDVDIRQEQQNLNTFAVTMIHNTNELHREGYTLSNETGLDYFVERPAVLNALGNYDSDLDGAFDQTWIYGVSGQNSLELSQQVGFAGTMTLPGRAADETVEVVYNSTDTVQDVIKKINASSAEVVASLNTENQLSLQASAATDPVNFDFVIRSLEDSGQFLVGYAGILQQTGAAGAFTWQEANATNTLQGGSFTVAPFLNPAASFELNPAVAVDPRRVAAAEADVNGVFNPGDNRVALEIANIRIRDLGLANVESYDTFFSHSIANIGAKGQEAEVLSLTQNQIVENLRERQSEVSGVDLDEELQDLVKFQTAYQGVARFLTTLDSIYDVLLSI